MSNTFHMAILAGELEDAKKFYCDVLGCKTGNFEEGHWVDIDFWGNELTLHQSDSQSHKERHHVDMGDVCVPHYGIHLTEDEFQTVKKRVEDAGIPYVDKPYRRFVGNEFEQETFFIADPNGNVLEIKTMMNPDVLFKMNAQKSEKEDA